jgi:hypothetical protein
MPDGTRELGQHESGRAWLDQLPGLLDEVAERWQLSIGDAFPDASASLTLRATRADGEACGSQKLARRFSRARTEGEE